MTVCTPTFNRRHTLARVMESLRRQTADGFEWLVVDDGSTDGTEELVKSWQAGASFPVRYRRQENAGKHAAVRAGAMEAHGELMLVADSDDAFTPDTIHPVIRLPMDSSGKVRPASHFDVISRIYDALTVLQFYSSP